MGIKENYFWLSASVNFQIASAPSSLLLQNLRQRTEGDWLKFLCTGAPIASEGKQLRWFSPCTKMEINFEFFGSRVTLAQFSFFGDKMGKKNQGFNAFSLSFPSFQCLTLPSLCLQKADACKVFTCTEAAIFVWEPQKYSLREPLIRITEISTKENSISNNASSRQIPLLVGYIEQNLQRIPSPLLIKCFTGYRYIIPPSKSGSSQYAFYNLCYL